MRHLQHVARAKKYGHRLAATQRLLGDANGQDRSRGGERFPFLDIGKLRPPPVQPLRNDPAVLCELLERLPTSAQRFENATSFDL